MSVTYGVTEEIYSLGTNSRTSYGIAAYADVKDDGTATIIAYVHDITADKKALTELVLLAFFKPIVILRGNLLLYLSDESEKTPCDCTV